jgi:hypothetical protein
MVVEVLWPRNYARRVRFRGMQRKNAQSRLLSRRRKTDRLHSDVATSRETRLARCERRTHASKLALLYRSHR